MIGVVGARSGVQLRPAHGGGPCGVGGGGGGGSSLPRPFPRPLPHLITRDAQDLRGASERNPFIFERPPHEPRQPAFDEVVLGETRRFGRPAPVPGELALLDRLRLLTARPAAATRRRSASPCRSGARRAGRPASASTIADGRSETACRPRRAPGFRAPRWPGPRGRRRPG